jgi:capsular exopolysaccharide synthesis family protein
MATLQKSSGAAPTTTTVAVRTQQQQESIRIQDIFYICLSKWYWIVFSLCICLGGATLYLLKTESVYTRSASILIKDDSSKGGGGGAQSSSLASLGIFGSSANVYNEMTTLKSSDLMREVVSRLHLNMNVQVDATFHRRTVYGHQLPIEITLPDLNDHDYASFTLALAADGSYRLSDVVYSTLAEGEKVQVDGRCNDTIQTPMGRLVVQQKNADVPLTKETYYVTRGSLDATAAGYAARLLVTRESEQVNIISLTISDVSTQRAEDILNTLIAVYNENWVKDKNQVALSTSIFINERLGVIEQELGDVDYNISSYKSENMIPDAQSAASLYINKAEEAKAAILELNNQVYMVRYIRDYVTNDAHKHELLPAFSGLGSETVGGQISQYNSLLLERNSLVAGSSDKNPLVVQMDEELASLRTAMIRSIDNQLIALDAQIKSVQGVGGQASAKIASSPNQAKYLLSVERRQKVMEALYLFLLEKREENELSQAFTAYNTRIVNKPGGSMVPTSPNAMNILLIAFAVGFLLPIAIIFLRETMNTVVRSRKDLDSLPIPFVGEIPQYMSRKKGMPWKRRRRDERRIVVKEGRRDYINEAFRVLRTNLEFMTNREGHSNVLLLTSFNPGSGKSFLATNISVCLAIKGMRVLTIDGDLRHASASAYVGSPKQGLSDYLGGKVTDLHEIIVADKKYPNLHMLPVGTIPPNPTELLYSQRLQDVIDQAREEYDYVLIDCPPIDMMADTQIIEQYADRTIFIVRAGLFDRGMLPELEKIYLEKKYKNMSIILNGTTAGGGHYGYHYGSYYGHYYGKGYYGKNYYGKNYYGDSDDSEDSAESKE